MNKEIKAEVLVMIDTLQSSSPNVDKHLLRIKSLLEAEIKLFFSALHGSIDPDRDPNWRKGRKSAAKNAERAIQSFTAALSALYEEDALGAATTLQSINNSSTVSKSQSVPEPAFVSRSLKDMIHRVPDMSGGEWAAKIQLSDLLEESDVAGNYKRWMEYEHTQTMRAAAARSKEEAFAISENLFHIYKMSGKDAVEIMTKAQQLYRKLLQYESDRLPVKKLQWSKELS